MGSVSVNALLAYAAGARNRELELRNGLIPLFLPLSLRRLTEAY